MNATADYREAVGHLTRPLPAYVTYVQHLHAKMDAFTKDENNTVTVRTRDGHIVKGHVAPIVIGRDTQEKGSLVTTQIFKPSCYKPVAASEQSFDGRRVEAITLAGTCKSEDNNGDHNNHDFSVLYVDPGDHAPIAVIGGTSSKDDSADVRLEEHWAQVAQYTLPSALSVRIKGHGWLFLLDVGVNVALSNYKFSEKAP